jgi:uncharacterized protein with PQ loop repeat
MENIGWLGSILLAFCGLPQAVESIKTKSSEGLTWGFIGMWFLGEILTFIYILPKLDLPLLFNYTANIIFLSIIIFYKLCPKK